MIGDASWYPSCNITAMFCCFISVLDAAPCGVYGAIYRPHTGGIKQSYLKNTASLGKKHCITCYPSWVICKYLYIYSHTCGPGAHFIQISIEASFSFHPICSEVITMKFCTWHESCAVVAHAKFCNDMVPYCRIILKPIFHQISLQWCHSKHDGVSNYRRMGCLLNRLFMCRSKKTSKLRVTGVL